MSPRCTLPLWLAAATGWGSIVSSLLVPAPTVVFPMASSCLRYHRTNSSLQRGKSCQTCAGEEASIISPSLLLLSSSLSQTRGCSNFHRRAWTLLHMVSAVDQNETTGQNNDNDEDDNNNNMFMESAAAEAFWSSGKNYINPEQLRDGTGQPSLLRIQIAKRQQQQQKNNKKKTGRLRPSSSLSSSSLHQKQLQKEHIHLGHTILPQEEKQLQSKSNTSPAKTTTTTTTKTISPLSTGSNWLERTTNFILTETNVGELNLHSLYDVQMAMTSWAKRQSRNSALMVERLLRRVVEEKMAGNLLDQTTDMASMYTTAISGWADSGEQRAAMRAEEILENMQQMYEDGDPSVKPDISSFNAVLFAWAKSGEPDSAQQALRVLNRMRELHRFGKNDVLPNTDSYCAIMQAYARGGTPDAPDRVWTLLRHAEKLHEAGVPNMKPNLSCHKSYLTALLESINRGYMDGEMGARRAEEHLRRMEESNDDDIIPDVWSYNLVISAWGKSTVPGSIRRAEKILERLERRAENPRYLDMKPNIYSYNRVLDAYARSDEWGSAQRAHALLLRMEDLSSEDPSLKPDVVTYNCVMNAYAKSGEDGSARRCEEILKHLQELYEETGDISLMPNVRSFNTCLDAWAKSGESGATRRAMAIISMMEANYRDGKSIVRPNTWSYNTVLQAIAKSGEMNCGLRAEDILNRMNEMEHAGNRNVKPDVTSFTCVINAWAASKDPTAGRRALAILDRMEELHEDGYEQVEPNIYTYNSVLNAIAKSKDAGRARMALNVLRRMDSSVVPNIMSYNNVLNACAFSFRPDDDEEDAMAISLQILRETQETCGANYITYGTFLRAISNLMPVGEERRKLVEKTIRECCRDGQLSGMVLNQLRHAADPDMYSSFIKEATRGVDLSTGKLRPDWTRNAGRRR